MLSFMVVGKGRNFEKLHDGDHGTIGGCFVLDEETFKDGVKGVRSWLVWVRKSQCEWAQKKIGTGQYKVAVIADDFAPSVNFAGELRMLEVSSL